MNVENDDNVVNEEIIAQSLRDHNNQSKKLKKANIAAVFGSGMGRIALICVGGAFFVLICVAVYNLFGKKPPMHHDSVPAQAALLNSPSQGGDLGVASDVEEAMRKEANNRNAEEAQAAGAPYMAPPVLRVDTETTKTAPDEKKTDPEAERRKQTAPEAAAANQMNAQLLAEMKTLRAQLLAEVTPQMIVAMGKTEGPGPSITTGNYTLPDRSKADAAVGVNYASATASVANSATTAKPKPFIAAGEAFYCELKFGINTDAAQKNVFANCYQGKMNGATLVGKSEQSGEGSNESSVSLTFTTLARPSKPSLPVQAIAIDDQTENAGLADDVNNHTIERYGGLTLASLARGFGKAASIITGSTTSTSNGINVTQTTAIDPIDGARQVKIALGEVGSAVGDSLQKRSDSIKTTVKVFSGKSIRIVFLSDVFE